MHIDATFRSRRSNVLATRGMVATSQPLAAQAGLDMLKAGGNAADAAIATAAMLNVVEPLSTGIGGDCFALYYDAETRQVTALNGSGRAPAAASIEAITSLGYTKMPAYTGHSVSVPGTVAGWSDLLERHGRMDAGRRAAAGHLDRGKRLSGQRVDRHRLAARRRRNCAETRTGRAATWTTARFSPAATNCSSTAERRARPNSCACPTWHKRCAALPPKARITSIAVTLPAS